MESILKREKVNTGRQYNLHCGDRKIRLLFPLHGRRLLLHGHIGVYWAFIYRFCPDVDYVFGFKQIAGRQDGRRQAFEGMLEDEQKHQSDLFCAVVYHRLLYCHFCIFA